jgi:hypothetical protein
MTAMTSPRRCPFCDYLPVPIVQWNHEAQLHEEAFATLLEGPSRRMMQRSEQTLAILLVKLRISKSDRPCEDRSYLAEARPPERGCSQDAFILDRSAAARLCGLRTRPGSSRSNGSWGGPSHVSAAVPAHESGTMSIRVPFVGDLDGRRHGENRGLRTNSGRGTASSPIGGISRHGTGRLTCPSRNSTTCPSPCSAISG